MTLIKMVEFAKLGDERGSLVSLEENKNIPFDIKRSYYIFDTQENVSRGFHAHKKLRQLAVCVKGACTIKMDDGCNIESITLDSPTQGLLIEAMQWHEMSDFSEDCVLLVLANDYYKESDYIRDYSIFKEEAKNVRVENN